MNTHYIILAMYTQHDVYTWLVYLRQVLFGALITVFSQERRQLKKEEVIDIAKQIAGGMVAVHEKGVVHCDLKPENIMVLPTKQIKIIDFGLAGEISDRQHMAKGGGSFR
jgi:serine/threonine protein kinase